mgnify:CR=1 FL=1
MSKSTSTGKRPPVTNPDAQPTITADTPVVTSPRFGRDESEKVFHLRARDTDTPEPRCGFADRADTDWEASTRGDLPADAELCEWCDPSVDHRHHGPTHSLAAKLADPDVRSVADLNAEEVES